MTRAAQKYDGGRGIFMPDCEIQFKLAEMVKIKDANTHANRNKEACLEISHSHLGVASIARPSSHEYAPEDLPKDDDMATYVSNEATNNVDDDETRAWLPPSLFHPFYKLLPGLYERS